MTGNLKKKEKNGAKCVAQGTETSGRQARCTVRIHGVHALLQVAVRPSLRSAYESFGMFSLRSVKASAFKGNDTLCRAEAGDPTQPVGWGTRPGRLIIRLARPVFFSTMPN